MTEDTARERFVAAPRPLQFIRIRVYREGPAEWLLELLEDEKDTLMDDLGKARASGKTEDSDEVSELREQLQYCLAIKRDLESGMIELAGPIMRRETNG